MAKAPETAQLINLSRTINTSMPHFVVENINELMRKVDGKVVTIFGLTYKGNVDDIRESPAMEILELLQDQDQYEVRAFDPHVKAPWVIEDIEAATESSDLIVILSDHNEFKKLEWDKLNGMASKRIFDTKNVVLNPVSDFEYINFGNLYQALKKEEILV